MDFGLSGPHKHKLESGAEVTIFNMGKARIHTYVAPDKSFGNATHIIETPNYLSIVDTQYLVPYSREFRNYANDLNKTIAGVVISHPHPDHYFGLWAFSDVKSYALPEVINDIKTKGPAMIKDSKKNLGDLVPDKVTIPTDKLFLGDVTVDGLLFKYKKYNNAEADIQLVIELPDINTVIVQDIIYNRYHPWMGKHTDEWIDLLKVLSKEYKKDRMILVGHGPPTSPSSYKRMIDYLTKAKSVINSSNGDHKEIESQLINLYPKYKGRNIIPMWLEYL